MSTQDDPHIVRGGPNSAGPSWRPALPSTRVLATVDSERYTAVDITDVLDDGSVIRTRILTKLGIWEHDDQAQSLIYETEIGSVAIGDPLSDQLLSKLSHERGDSRASLAFFVRRPTPQITNDVPSPSHSQPTSDVGDSETSNTSDLIHKRRRRRGHFIFGGHRDENLSPSPTTPSSETTQLLAPSIVTPVDADRGDKPTGPPRRVRPLPPLPTPTQSGDSSKSSHGTPIVSPQTLGVHQKPPGEGTRATNNSSIISTDQQIDNDGQTDNLPKRPNTPASFKWKRGKLIGTGIHGPVYIALDNNSGDIIAVKQIQIPVQWDVRAQSIITAYRGESEILQKLDHPNIVKYLHMEESLSTLNIFMEYVPGGNITSCLKTYGKFNEENTKSFTAQVLNGLAYLHSQQLIHRHLKADNILLQNNGVCKIADFAVSKYADDNGFVFTALQGSVFWMAPEVVDTRKRGYNYKVDIWSLGCLVTEMWTGIRPWDGLDASTVMYKLYISRLPPPLPENISLTKLAEDFHKQCFVMNPEERPTAKNLLSHPYLILPKDWEFAGFDALERPPVEASIDEVPSVTVTSVGEQPLEKSQCDSWSLDRFQKYSSAFDSPGAWLDVNHKNLIQYILNSESFDANDRAKLKNWVNIGMIYERLVVHTYERLKAGPADGISSHLADLEESLNKWIQWDRTKMLYNYMVISDRLRAFPGWKNGTTLRNIVALDVESICARLHEILNNVEQYRYFVNTAREQSQVMLNLLQTLLDSPSLDRSYRNSFTNALLRLSRKFGLYPEALLQKSVTLIGEDAVAAGQFGDVWRGSFEGKTVAVKVLKLYMQSDLANHLKKVLHETLIWRQLQHANVLPFLCLYHVNNNRARVGLVSPWMENGNVQQFLRKNPDANRVSLVRDVAEGLEYLHTMQPSIVHGDLKAVNILITDTHTACLADFGLSRASDSQVLRLSSFSGGQTGGTSRWTAPELLDGSQTYNNIMSDVYAFACVCYEIFSGHIPFHDIGSDFPVILKVIQGERPPRPSHCEPSKIECTTIGLDDAMWCVISECWAGDPDGRPTTSGVVARLPTRATLPRAVAGIRHYSPEWELISWAMSSHDKVVP